MPPLVSICLTCKDRWELTRQALESIKANTSSSLFSMLVVDDDSAHESKDALVDWFHKNPWTQAVVSEKTRGVGGSKNFAAGTYRHFFSQTKYLCLLDNDVVCKPGWLETLILAYEQGKSFGYRLIGGYAHPFNQTNRIHEMQCTRFGSLETINSTLHEKNAVDGLCHFMDWDTWYRFGPYDSHAQGVRQSEDFAFCRKIVDAGFKVGVVYPHVIENHGVVDTFGQKIPGAELVEAELQK